MRDLKLSCSFLLKGKGQTPRLIAGSTRTFQSFAHLIEGGAIDLAARIASAQDLQCVRFKRRVKRSARVSPTEPAECTPAEERHDPYPEQWQQRPEFKSPMHIDPHFLIRFYFHKLVQQTLCLSLYPQYIQ